VEQVVVELDKAEELPTVPMQPLTLAVVAEVVQMLMDTMEDLE
jgi:hypothetical protein